MTTYKELLPGTEEHRQLIEEAVLTNDLDTLQRLKGRLKEPIHVIKNYREYIAVRNGKAVAVNPDGNHFFLQLPDGRTFNWEGLECNPPKPSRSSISITIPNGTVKDVRKQIYG